MRSSLEGNHFVEHRSIFSTPHQGSHVPELRRNLKCLTQPRGAEENGKDNLTNNKETSLECTKSVQSETEEPEHKLTPPGRRSQGQFSECKSQNCARTCHKTKK
ncbi:hypothetical protein NDU88_007789 [Pleurodeles waltl]|uniref:Uncharacterized protein n=1 Tax=Pleurodeles waltl TaxID=8319 RepID=A0AAV7STH5_PLEWA|nr:hypothetical protein NDU88_007789 [Pleurodeles waltl]